MQVVVLRDAAALGEAAYLVKQEIASAVLPVGMPPLAEMIRKVVEHRVPVWV